MTHTSFISRSSAHLKNLCSDRPHVFIAFATVLCFAAVKALLFNVAGQPALRLMVFVLACIVALAAFGSLQTRTMPRASRLVFRGIIALFSIYLLLSTPSVLTEPLSAVLTAELLTYHWFAPVLGALAWWRAAWALPLLIAMLWQKSLLAGVLGIIISSTDYMPVLEFGMMLTIGSFLLSIAQHHLQLRQARDDELPFLDVVMLTAVAAHFANYLYSGVQKVVISTPWWQWATDNATYYLTLAALEIGAAPISIFGEDTVNTLLDLQIASNAYLNSVLLALQLSAIIAITRIRWAAVLTFLYDVTHVVIFLVTGIFFYKWIWLNLLITISLATLARRKLTGDIIVWLVAVTVFAPHVFYVVFLGWFDTPSFNDEHIEAIVNDGTIYRIPSNYFLSTSITAGQQRLIRKKPGHFPTDAYGSMGDPTQFDIARNCLFDDNNSISLAKTRERDRVIHLLREHHSYVLKNLQENGTIEYDLYPHHIFSMPWEYSEFYGLDKRRIVRYRYVNESKCLSYRDRNRTAKILRREEFDVNLQ